MQKAKSTAPPNDDQRFADLQQWFEARMIELDIPGAALGVIHGDWSRSVGLGVTNLQTKTPVTPTTVFRVASLTKVLTATAIVSMIDNAERRLDAPISSWYAPFAVEDSKATAKATMRHLLSHSGGWADVPFPEDDPSGLTLSDVAGDITTAKQLVAPGTLFNYSNSSFLLAGHILATLSSTSYEEVIRTRILQPLQMQHSGFAATDVSGLELASGHTEGDSGLQPNDPWDIVPAFNPAGGLITTVDDMLNFVRFFADPRSIDHLPLTADQKLDMQRAHGPGGSLGPIMAEAMGLGWMVTRVGDQQVAISFGSDSGAAAGMMVNPDRQFGLVVLANADPGLLLATESLGRALETFLQVPSESRPPVDISPAELSSLAGTYSIPGELAFEVNVTDDQVSITARAGDDIVPILTGPVRMQAASVGEFMVGSMPVLIDFIRDVDGQIGWIRSFARVAPRVG